MLKKTITYNDYNGTQRTEDFYFNLSKAEIMEMEMGTTGGLAEMIQRIVAAQDAPAIIKVFKDLVLKAYGEKSADGKTSEVKALLGKYAAGKLSGVKPEDYPALLEEARKL